MYYRWTKRAENIDRIKTLRQEVGKWYRARWSTIKDTIPEYYHLVHTGYIEEKPESSSPKQLAQRRMWQYSGRMLALISQEAQLVIELREEYPTLFKRMAHRDIIQEFYDDVANIDQGLLLKKYYPDLFKPDLPA